jgi:hypothetical protein
MAACPKYLRPTLGFVEFLGLTQQVNFELWSKVNFVYNEMNWVVNPPHNE